MKITRSSKVNLKYLTESKKAVLAEIQSAYSEVVNHYIKDFWEDTPGVADLTKHRLGSPSTWLTARMVQCAAREAIGMIKAAKERWKKKAVKPTHRGTRMCLSSGMIQYQTSKNSSEFDGWLALSSIGRGIKLLIPVRGHRHFNKLDAAGKMNGAWIITDSYVQFSWKIETGPKLPTDKTRGVDTGINALVSTSDGLQFGTDIKQCIDVIKRREHGSKGQKRATARLKQRIGEVAKETIDGCNAIVVEKLKNITKNTKKNPKRRLGKNMRRSIGRWNVSYWIDRLKQLAEWNRVSFRSVPAYYTSVMCPSCGKVDRGNRNGTVFKCRNCNHTDNADVNAAKNIVLRLTTGRYGACFKPLL